MCVCTWCGRAVGCVNTHKKMVLRSTHLMNKARSLKSLFDVAFLLPDSPGSGRLEVGSEVLLDGLAPCCSRRCLGILLLLLVLHLGLYVMLVCSCCTLRSASRCARAVSALLCLPVQALLVCFAAGGSRVCLSSAAALSLLHSGAHGALPISSSP